MSKLTRRGLFRTIAAAIAAPAAIAALPVPAAAPSPGYFPDVMPPRVTYVTQEYGLGYRYGYADWIDNPRMVRRCQRELEETATAFRQMLARSRGVLLSDVTRTRHDQMTRSFFVTRRIKVYLREGVTLEPRSAMEAQSVGHYRTEVLS